MFLIEMVKKGKVKKLVSLALAAAMTFMLTSVNPVPNSHKTV